MNGAGGDLNIGGGRGCSIDRRADSPWENERGLRKKGDGPLEKASMQGNKERRVGLDQSE